MRTAQRLLVTVAALSAFTLAPFTARGDVPADTVQQMREAAEESGEIALGEIAAFHQTFLSDVTIQGPAIASGGSVRGTTTFAGKDARVVLQYIEKEFGGLGHWILAIKPPTERLGDLAPAVRGSIVDDLQLSTPIVIFAKEGANIRSTQLDPAVREFYSSVYGDEDFSFRVSDGVNVLAAAQAQAEVQVGMKMLGIDLERLVLQGVILKNFDAEELRQAKEDGRLLKAMAKNSELKAVMRNLRIAGLPKDFITRDFALLVTGEPAVGLEFFMTVGTGPAARDFQCRGKFLFGDESQPGVKGVSISARTDSEEPWQDALGIKGLALKSLALEIRYERSPAGPPSVGFGVGGDMKFGKKYVEVVGGLQSKAGVVTGFFKGSIDSITRDDLVAVVNEMATAKHGVGIRAIDGDALPDFELRDVTINYAPAGGSEELGVKSGVGLKGRLYLFGSPTAEIDGIADVSQEDPVVTIQGSIHDFDLGEFSMKDAELDVLMAAPKGHFRIKGSASVLGNSASAEMDLSPRFTFVKMAGKVAGAFEADFLYSTPTLDNPAWDLEVGFKDGLSNELKENVSADILHWADQVEREFNKAQADLAKARQEVERLNAVVDAARAQVQRERDTHKAALQQAERQVRRIDTAIAEARQQVQRERDMHQAGIRKLESDVEQWQTKIDARRSDVEQQRDRDLASHKRRRDNAKKAYDNASRAYKRAYDAWKKAKGLDKVRKAVTKNAKKVDRDATKTTYDLAKRAYDTASAAINKVPVDADPQIVLLTTSKKGAEDALRSAKETFKRVHGRVPVDADPRVVALKGTRDGALRALGDARRAFDLAHKVPVEADPRVATPLGLRNLARKQLDAASAVLEATNASAQWGATFSAAAARGEVIAVEQARLRGKLSAYLAGSKMEFSADLRVLNEPKSVRFAMRTDDLANGKLFAMIAETLKPSPNKRSSRRSSDPGQNSRQPRGDRVPSPGGARRAPTDTGYSIGATRSEGTRTRRPGFAEDLASLEEELLGMQHGADWIHYLRLTDLKPTAGNGLSDNQRRELLAKFDTVASNPKYRVISRLSSFQDVHTALRAAER